MQGSLDKPPGKPGPGVGRGTKACREVRQLGRQLLDARMLIFGVGRGELRDMFLIGYANLTQNFQISAVVKVRAQMEMCEAMANSVRSISTLCNYLRILQGIVHNRTICPDRFKPFPESAGGSDEVGRSTYLRFVLKIICSHSIWRSMPIVSRLIPDLLAPLDVARHTVWGVPLRVQDSPFMEDRPKATKKREAWEKDVRSRREGSFYWGEALRALEELAWWLRMEMLFFKKEIVHWDSKEQKIPGARSEKMFGTLTIIQSEFGFHSGGARDFDPKAWGHQPFFDPTAWGHPCGNPVVGVRPPMRSIAGGTPF